MELTVSKLPVWERIKFFVKDHKKGIVIGLIAFAIVLTGLFALSFCEFVPDDDRGALMELADSMSDSIAGTFSGAKIKEKINYEPPGAAAAAGSINGLLQGWAISILFILWFPSILTAFINQQAYAELMFKKFLVLGIGVALIMNSQTICTGIASIGTELVASVAGEGGDAVENPLKESINAAFEEKANEVTEKINQKIEDSKSLSDEVDAMNEEAEASLSDGVGLDDVTLVGKSIFNLQKGLLSFIASPLVKWYYEHIGGPVKYAVEVKFAFAIGVIVRLFIPWLIIKAAYVMVIVATYGRTFEILILTALSPIPFCLLTGEPLGSGSGTRFLKNLAALSIQGAVMLIIGNVGSSVITTALASSTDFLSFDAIIEASALAVAMGALMLKSLSISQKALGLQ